MEANILCFLIRFLNSIGLDVSINYDIHLEYERKGVSQSHLPKNRNHVFDLVVSFGQQQTDFIV